MPIHDWSKVDANLFHHFHQAWTVTICNRLNAGLLPPGFSALVEQHAPTMVPGVLTVERGSRESTRLEPNGGGVLTEPRPKTRYLLRAQQASMAARANRITIRHSMGRIVCVIEIVSPGNKQSQKKLQKFVEKSVAFLDNGVNLLVVDLFPPTPRDPHGIHAVIWDEIEEDAEEFAPDKPLTLAAYTSGDPIEAYVEPIAVDDVMPDMPAYLDDDHYVPVPLEGTYMETWSSCSEHMREIVENAR